MQRMTEHIIGHKKVVLLLFTLLTLISIICMQTVKVNYNIIDYLPDSAPSTIAYDVLEKEFTTGIPNVRLMVTDVSIPEALALKTDIEAIDGIRSVLWLDDMADVNVPLATLDSDIMETYYRGDSALYTITVDDVKAKTAMHALRELVGKDAAMSGMRVNTTFASENINSDLAKVMLLAVPIILVILLFTSNSWIEPFLFLITLGVAIVLNMGTNVIFGEISFITMGVAAILQLAVSMDYAIFILHRFSEYRERTERSVPNAMSRAVVKSFPSVAASGLTTAIGFAALILMRIKIGPDVGWVMIKAIFISLTCVFTLLPALTVCSVRLIDKTQHRPLLPNLSGFARLGEKIKYPTLIAMLLVLIPCVLAVNNSKFVYFDIFVNPRTSLGYDAMRIEETFGEANNLVLMVSKGDLAKEKALAEEIRAIDNVTGIVSFTENVGAEIPPAFVPDEKLSELESEHYTRLVLTLGTPMENDETFDTVVRLRELGEQYYGADGYHLAGESANTYDMKTIIEEDNTRINLIAIAAVFVSLLITFRSLSVPVILIFAIESAIWINCATPYFSGDALFFIAYLVIGSLQLGATVDYAILFTNRYFEFRATFGKRQSLIHTFETAVISILASGSILFVAGVALSVISTNSLLAELGTLVARGALLSLASVLLALPGMLTAMDPIIQKTSLKCKFANPIEKEETV